MTWENATKHVASMSVSKVAYSDDNNNNNSNKRRHPKSNSPQNYQLLASIQLERNGCWSCNLRRVGMQIGRNIVSSRFYGTTLKGDLVWFGKRFHICLASFAAASKAYVTRTYEGIILSFVLVTSVIIIMITVFIVATMTSQIVFNEGVFTL